MYCPVIPMPVLCMSCGNLLNDTEFRDLLARGYTDRQALDLSGTHLLCCRMQMLSTLGVGAKWLPPPGVQALAPPAASSSASVDASLADRRSP